MRQQNRLPRYRIIITFVLFGALGACPAAFATPEKFDCSAGAMALDDCHSLCLKHNRYADVYDFGDCAHVRSATCDVLEEIISKMRRTLVANHCDLSVFEKQIFDVVLD